MSPPHLVLGTAQLGLPYGIANKVGQPDQAVATAIIHEAWKNGIREFDTAQGYGDSEKVLGKALAELGFSKEARIISKFDSNLDHLNASDMSRALDESLERLGVRSLYGIMLHREEMLSLWNKGLAKILQAFILSGRVEKIGISVYSPDKAIQALNTEGIIMVQLPTNILDRRFENAGVFKLADEKRKTIYIRSVFLQGLILMNPEEVPDKMDFARPVLEKLESLSNDFGLSRQEMALGYIKSEIPNAHVIFGAETPAQVTWNVECWHKSYPQSLNRLIKEAFKEVNERLLNPTLWSN
ncbi:MAG: aldo/keto reductase [Proteobacteria bacterium]|nr:aldo/keto reductase [Pseudomonadota bacterium]MBU4068195.1 aldo/keto reductase [Pseudomonadota bacterium]MBU4128235.1 aldo/keto reductase [Pseudomonadota bacterium]